MCGLPTIHPEPDVCMLKLIMFFFGLLGPLTVWAAVFTALQMGHL
jgi:hypothetical protein